MEDMFNRFGDNPIFQEMVKSIVKDAVLKIANDLQQNNISIDDDIIDSTVRICLSNESAIVFFKSINLVVNAKEEIAFQNVNEFLQIIEAMYFKGNTILEG